MLHEQKHTDGEQKNAITATLRLLLDYDSRSADSKIRKVFVNYGGMALILDNEPLVSHCFLNDTHSRMDSHLPYQWRRVNFRTPYSNGSNATS